MKYVHVLRAILHDTHSVAGWALISSQSTVGRCRVSQRGCRLPCRHTASRRQTTRSCCRRIGSNRYRLPAGLHLLGTSCTQCHRCCMWCLSTVSTSRMHCGTCSRIPARMGTLDTTLSSFLSTPQALSVLTTRRQTPRTLCR